MVKFEKYSKKGREDGSKMHKLSIQYFLNTTLIILIVNYYFDNIWIYGGLISQVTFFLFSNLLSRVIAPLCDLGYIYKIIKQFYYEKNRPYKSQVKLNKLYEYKEFDFAVYSALVLSQVFHTLFFCSLVPITPIVCIITQSSELWVHKYVILRRCSAIKKLGDELFKQVLKYLDLAPFCFAAGTLLIYRMMQGRLPWLYFISLGVSILWILLPSDWITWGLVRVSKVQRGKCYMDYHSKFDREMYQLWNPIREAKYMAMSDFTLE